MLAVPQGGILIWFSQKLRIIAETLNIQSEICANHFGPTDADKIDTMATFPQERRDILTNHKLYVDLK